MTVYRRTHTNLPSIILAVACMIYVSLSVACSDTTTTPATESVSTVAPTPEPTSTPTPEPTATATPTPTFTSNISGYSLSNITISAGTVIKWINSHSAPHTVTSGTPGNLSDIWDSGTISNGNSYSY